jgi:hypothetical protein
MTVVEIRAAKDRFIALPRPIVFDDGRRVEGRSSMGQSVCAMLNSKPVSNDSALHDGAMGNADVAIHRAD